MVTVLEPARPAPSSSSRTIERSRAWRWSVHLLLIATAIGALVVEPILTLHIVVGLVFVALVVVHLLQRKQASVRLLRHLASLKGLHRRPGRLAVADTLLLLITSGMLASGIWDWALGHPTRIRWHAVTGILLTAYLVVHTVRRRSRLFRSRIR